MDLYKELDLKPVRSEPKVWVSRLVILERLLPEPVPIRDVTLTRGLNIIWAEEPEEANAATQIGGHSAGKTTFCRLLRYVLGERTFGTKGNMELVRKALPEGYVAAEIHVAGKHWAVRRPFGSNRMSFVKANASVEELLKQSGGSVPQEDYVRKLGLEDLIDEMETGAMVRTGENIEWGHVLAWCTRDQEARFQNIHDWRSPRSESSAPTFRFSKGGPLFVMRAALGLFLPDELKGEEKLAELQRERDRLEKETEEKRREPQFRVNLYDHELRQRLKAYFPGDPEVETLPLYSGNLFQDLYRLTDRAISDIGQAMQSDKQSVVELQDQIDRLGAEIRQHEGDFQKFDALFGIAASAGPELDGDLSGRREQRERFKQYQDSMCPLGRIVFKDCSHILAIQSKLRTTELQDAHLMDQAEARRRQEKQRIDKEKSDLGVEIHRLCRQREGIMTQRDVLEIRIRAKYQDLHDLTQLRTALITWTQRRDQETGYDELIALRQKLDDINNRIEELEKELTGSLRQHDTNRELLNTIFSGIIRSVLSSDGYDGVVSLDNRELAFRITHGSAMSGEAVETLSVLLADVASLIYYTVSDRVHLPGFLLHDSPREADLGIRIYRSFIRVVASLQAQFGGTENCPFQYILTTTTAPPEEQRKPEFLRLSLNAAKVEGLLLKRNVAAVIEHRDGDLFQGDE